MPALDELENRARARVGTVLKDKWTLDALLGIGGMASVYSATHRNLKRVAIKMLHPELSSSSEMRTRFKREGYVANSVAHRGVVRVDDDDVTEDGAAFLVMELLEGETLHNRWARKGQRIKVMQVLSYVDQLLDVLIAAHEKGIVHRDLKPENLFLLRDGTLKVLDFGIARIRELSQGQTGGTRQGTLMGTPAFMAPEQARGRWEFVDEQTDVWAVGAIMFTLLSGEFVYQGETENEQLALACTTQPRGVATVVHDLPQGVASLIDRALAYDKAARWPNARAMLHELRTVAFAMEHSEAPVSTAQGAAAGERSVRVGSSPSDKPNGGSPAHTATPVALNRDDETNGEGQGAPRTATAVGVVTHRGEPVSVPTRPLVSPGAIAAGVAVIAVLGIVLVTRSFSHHAALPTQVGQADTLASPAPPVPVQPAAGSAGEGVDTNVLAVPALPSEVPSPQRSNNRNEKPAAAHATKPVASGPTPVQPAPKAQVPVSNTPPAPPPTAPAPAPAPAKKHRDLGF